MLGGGGLTGGGATGEVSGGRGSCCVGRWISGASAEAVAVVTSSIAEANTAMLVRCRGRCKIVSLSRRCILKVCLRYCTKVSFAASEGRLFCGT